MPIVSASVPTANGSKYMQQLCKHWSHKLEVDLSEQKGVVRFPAAVVVIEARADDLSVTIDGSGERDGRAHERRGGLAP